MACDNEKYFRSVLNYDLLSTRFSNLKSLEVGEGSPFERIEEDGCLVQISRLCALHSLMAHVLSVSNV